jgi:hypothetical protein
MASQSPIVKKTNTLHDETIHIMPKCTMCLHGHWNKLVPLMKPFILANFNNDTKFHNYTWWSTNDISKLLSPMFGHHIGNVDVVLSSHVEISL